MPISVAKHSILLIEPWFASSGHIPFNRSFVEIIRAAYPAARIAFACSAEYARELKGGLGLSAIDVWIDAEAWTQSTTNGGIGEFWRRTRWLLGLFGRAKRQGIEPTHVIVLGASGPLLYAASVA